MSDLLHWYARIHGPRAFRIMQAARSGELDRERADAASAAQDETPFSKTATASTSQAAHWM